MAVTIAGINDNARVQIGVASATVIEAGDLIFRDVSTGLAKNAAAQTDQLTEEDNQRVFANRFLGVAQDGSASGSTTDILVNCDPAAEFKFTCASETHEIGDLLAVDEAGNGTELEDQKLVKVTDETLALFRCTRRDASASTTVYCRMIKSVAWPRPTVQLVGGSNTASSTAVTNTTTETDLDVTRKIDGAALVAGDMIEVLVGVVATATNGTDTLNVKLYVGTEEIAATGAVDVANNDIALIHAFITARAVGASGSLIAYGTHALGASGTVTAKAFRKAAATEDVSGVTTIKATATWSVANAGNSCALEVLDVIYHRKSA